MKSCVLILVLMAALISSAAGAAAKSSPVKKATVDRRALFTSVFDHLSAVFATFSNEEFYKTLSEKERSHFNSLAQILRQENSRQKRAYYDSHISVEFRMEQWLFDVQPGAPIRTARADSGRYDPIYINELIIENPANPFHIDDVVQLLIHELGHRVPDQDQQAMDSLAAKIRAGLDPFTHIIQLSADASIEVLTLPVWDSEGWRPDLKDRSLLVLRETNLVFENITGAIDDFFEDKKRLEAYGPRYGGDGEILIRRTMDWRESTEMNTHDGTPIVRVRFSRIEHLVGDDPFVLNPYTQAARQAHDVHEVEVDFDRRAQSVGKIYQMRFKKSYETVSDLMTDLKYDLSGDGHLHFQAKAKSEQAPLTFSLLLEVDGGDFELPGKLDAASGYWNFETVLPKELHSPSIIVRSAVADDKSIFPADHGVEIDTSAYYLAAIKPLLLRSIEVETKKKGYRGLVNTETKLPKVAPGKNKLRFIFDAHAPIRELRLTWSKTLTAYNVDYNVTTMDTMAYRENSYDPKARKYDYEIVYYPGSQLTQTIEGDHLVVELEVKDHLQNLSGPHETVHMGGFGLFSSGFNRSVSTLLAKDEGRRSIVELEAIDDHFNRVHLKPNKSFSYQVDAKLDPDRRKPMVSVMVPDKRKNWAEYRKCFAAFDDEL